jgi:nucleoside-diphosphate-sugar epimerase
MIFMRVVVTGASGFIGRGLLAHLRRDGVDVVGVSRREVDGILRVDDYSTAPGGDVLVHLAETADVGLVNRLGDTYRGELRSVRQALLDKNYSKIVYVSSAVLYGTSNSGLFTEDDPVSCFDTYSLAKRDSELDFLNVGATILRVGNVYGNAMSDKNVVSAILGQLKGRAPIRLREVASVRDFLWINDFVIAVATCVSCRCPGVFNVGSGAGVSILDLATHVLDIANQNGREVVAIDSSAASNRRVLDIRKFTEKTGWAPEVSLQDGLRKLLEAYYPVPT